VHPYVAAGLGVGKFSHEVERPPASIESTELGFNLGAGLTYALTNRAWLRGDFRFFNHIDDTPSVWRVAGAVTLRIGS
jgi:opacity protein-like surface antigen